MSIDNNYSYPIIEWNPVVDQQGATCVSIMFKPDLKALDLFNQSPLQKVIVTVSGCDVPSVNNNRMFVTIDKSSQVPDNRANLFDGSGLYTLVLPTPWTTYPMDHNGSVNLHYEEMKGIIQELKMTPPKTPSHQSVLASTNLKGKVVQPVRRTGSDHQEGDQPIFTPKPLKASSDPAPNSLYTYKSGVQLDLKSSSDQPSVDQLPKEQNVRGIMKDGATADLSVITGNSVCSTAGDQSTSSMLLILVIILLAYIFYKMK